MSVSSLVYLPCKRCKCETLHKSEACVHCGKGKRKAVVIAKPAGCASCGGVIPERKRWRGDAKYCSRSCAAKGNCLTMVRRRA